MTTIIDLIFHVGLGVVWGIACMASIIHLLQNRR